MEPSKVPSARTNASVFHTVLESVMAVPKLTRQHGMTREVPSAVVLGKPLVSCQMKVPLVGLVPVDSVHSAGSGVVDCA